MKNVVYLSSIFIAFTSCVSTKEFYDDVYDAAEKPETVIINPDAGYVDYIKDAEENHKVVIERNSISTQKTGFVSDAFANEPAEGCACDCDYIPHSVFYDLNGMTARRMLAQPDDYFGDCSCCKDIFMRRYESYAMYYRYPGFYRYNGMHPGFFYAHVYPGACQYLNYPTSAFGYDYASMYGYGHSIGGFDPMFPMNNYYPYWGSPYGYSSYNGYGNWGYGSYYGNGYYGNGWGNSGGWWGNGNGSGGAGVTNTGNQFYGHHGTTIAASANTTGYQHTVKEVAVTELASTGQVSWSITEAPVVAKQINPSTGYVGGGVSATSDFATGNTGNIQTHSGNTVITNGNTETFSTGDHTATNLSTNGSGENVTAKNPFATGAVKGGATGTVNPNGVRPAGSDVDYTNQYGRYVIPSGSQYVVTTSSNSTSRNSGTTYRTTGSTYNSSGSSATTTSSGSSYGHRTSTSGGSGSSGSSSSGSSRSTTTSRR